MNKATVQHKRLNRGKKTEIYVPYNKDVFKLYFEQIFDDEQYKKGKIKKDMVILDVGANVGFAALYFKDWAKKIYCFEPEKESFIALYNNVLPYKNIVPFNFGILENDCFIELKTNKDDSLGENFVSEIPDSVFGNGKVKEKVVMRNLDSVLKKLNVEHVDLLKIDCEASEYRIFQSRSFGEASKKIDYIIGESHHMHPYYPEFIPEILKEWGYKTEFLPITSYYRTLSFCYDNPKDNKFYRIGCNTIFFAHK